jgi:hypothetical protein
MSIIKPYLFSLPLQLAKDASEHQYDNILLKGGTSVVDMISLICNGISVC